jgi:mannose-6-phosphate isomerase-like protein (cupin superfamily)
LIEKIVFGQLLYAIIIRREFNQPGIHFFTPDEFSQQLASMSRPAGYQIQPHFHREVHRNIHQTQEVLVVRSGRLRVDYYDDAKCKIGNSILGEGDVILLSQGGHGFEMQTDCELIEIKQGPYLGDADKVRFDASPIMPKEPDGE